MEAMSAVQNGAGWPPVATRKDRISYPSRRIANIGMAEISPELVPMFAVAIIVLLAVTCVGAIPTAWCDSTVDGRSFNDWEAEHVPRS
jgi:hypothetical protein